jgi:ATP-dependent RNA helicase DDX1
LSAIEKHLGITIQQVETDFAVPVFEYDGKVSYGSKRAAEGLFYLIYLIACLGVSKYSHAVELTDAVRGLADLEREVQLNYLELIGA